MVYVRFLREAAGQWPALPGHLTTVSYADSSAASAAAPALGISNDQVTYGDVLSSTNRRHAPDAAGMDNGYYTITSIVAPKGFTATKIRFAVVVAGVVTGTPAVALSLYSNNVPYQNSVATAPITGAMLTTTGVKELTLSTPVTVNSGWRCTALWYIPPSAYSTRPSFASVANARAVLVNPSSAQLMAGYKAASAAPPVAIDTADGTWTAGTNVTTVVWWALL